MSLFIDITDRKQLNQLLNKLQPGTPALWGKMTAQHMIEHLIEQVKYTNGNKTASLEIPAQDAIERKQKWIYTNAEIPKGALSHLPLNDICYPDLQTAVKMLNKEIDAFYNYFKQPGITSIHGGLGEMNYNEWLTWHGKHFTYHFKQFGLLPAEYRISNKEC